MDAPTIPIILQARTNSSRYPQKILQKFTDELSLLEFQILRLKKAFPASPIIVATSTSPADQAIEDIAKKNNIYSFRGDENDVLGRFVNCCLHFQFTDYIIRICSDNPFLQLQLLKEMITEAKKQGWRDDYIGYSIDQVPAIRTHFGFFAEMIKVEALNKINNSVLEPFYREHVTNYIYQKGASAGFKVRLLELKELVPYSAVVRLTVDSGEDLENARLLYQSLDPSAGDGEIEWPAIVHFIDSNPILQDKMRQQIQLNGK